VSVYNNSIQKFSTVGRNTVFVTKDEMVMMKSTAFLATLGALGVCAQELNATTYDYVIVGGGTSGLTVANRLTENGKREFPPLPPSLLTHYLTSTTKIPSS
jgi:hypothetical protein